MKSFIKKIYKHLIIVSLLFFSIFLCLTRYKIAVVRFIDSIFDFIYSVKYYFLCFFDKTTDVTVTNLPDPEILKLLPYDVEEIFRKLEDMWIYVFDENCFTDYLNSIGKALENILMFIIFSAPLLLIFSFVFKDRLLRPNNKEHGKKTSFLSFFEEKIIPLWHKVYAWFKDLFDLYKLKRYFWPFLFIWMLNFNVLTIVLEALAFYFYFVFSVDLINIPIQFIKLLLDVIITLSGASVLFWLVLSYVTLRFLSNRIGLRRLRHREAVNRAFIAKQSIIIMNTGPMGNGKTTGAVDMTISTNITFRNKALELMNECYAMFPNFKWILFEDWLKKCIEHHKVYNLTTARDAVALRRLRFEKSPSKEGLFEYDYDLYSLEYNNELEIKYIFDVLSDYACLYFIYVVQSSLIISNISVRDDSEFVDFGNFPTWNNEMFNLSAVESTNRSQYSHISDYDAFRLGKKLIEDNPNNDSFEFGVVLFSEIGKERGNTLTLQEVKKGDDKTNQKNDLFSYSMKMIRHKATVMHYCFARVFMDEQRPESLGADMRDLLTIIHIRDKSDIDLLLPFFFVEELLHDLIYQNYVNFLTTYRFYRGDDCFPMFVYRNIVEAFHRWYVKKYNVFGCSTLNVELERGTMDGNIVTEKYFLCSKKIYSNKFSTDCYREFFEDKLRSSNVGIDDYPTYNNTVAARDELLRQNSYFISDMENIKK